MFTNQIQYETLIRNFMKIRLAQMKFYIHRQDQQMLSPNPKHELASPQLLLAGALDTNC
jgi:hypothetical protein